ncbi:MAG TPA: transporter substrate-binding domain-containing protein [Limnobacter sp.]|uniref:substrate-binding periplasmic protein n=1 Tax=Limnobacter sp. TaxID=2003368 RepID=UPI002EDA24EB
MNVLRRALTQRVVQLGLLVLTALSLPALAQEAEDWERVKASGVLKVAVYNHLEPFSDQGKGLDVDIAAALAKKLGLKIQVRAFNEDETMSDDLRNMVWKGHYLAGPPADILMHAPIDDYVMQQEKQVLFFNPYTRDDIFVARNVKSLPELTSLEPFMKEGNKIGAEAASLPSQLLAGADSGSYSSNLVNFKSPGEAVEAMLKGELVAVMATRAELEGALAKHPEAKGNFYVSRVPHNSLPPKGWVVGMATKKGNQVLAEKLTSAMNELKESGELAKLFQQYGLTYVRP